MQNQYLYGCFHSKNKTRAIRCVSGSVYTGPDPFETGTKSVRISLVFTRDRVNPVRIGSAIWYQMGPLMKVIPYRTVPFPRDRFSFEPVQCKRSGSIMDRIHNGSEHIRSCVNVALDTLFSTADNDENTYIFNFGILSV